MSGRTILSHGVIGFITGVAYSYIIGSAEWFKYGITVTFFTLLINVDEVNRTTTPLTHSIPYMLVWNYIAWSLVVLKIVDVNFALLFTLAYAEHLIVDLRISEVYLFPKRVIWLIPAKNWRKKWIKAKLSSLCGYGLKLGKYVPYQCPSMQRNVRVVG